MSQPFRSSLSSVFAWLPFTDQDLVRLSVVVAIAFTLALSWQPITAQQLPQASSQSPSSKKCEGPEYPPESFRQNEQGTTKIRFYVSEVGIVERTELVQSSGHERLDQAAVKALTSCPLKPVVENGVPVKATAVVEYVWKIE